MTASTMRTLYHETTMFPSKEEFDMEIQLRKYATKSGVDYVLEYSIATGNVLDESREWIIAPTKKILNGSDDYIVIREAIRQADELIKVAKRRVDKRKGAEALKKQREDQQ